MSWADLNLMPALPEIFLLSAVSVILVLDLFLSDKQRGITYLLSLLSLIHAAVIGNDVLSHEFWLLQNWSLNFMY